MLNSSGQVSYFLRLLRRRCLPHKLHSNLIHKALSKIKGGKAAGPSRVIFASQGWQSLMFLYYPWWIKLAFVESLRWYLLENCCFFSALFDVTVHKHVQYCITLHKYACDITICNWLQCFVINVVKCTLIGEASVSWYQWNALSWVQQKFASSTKGEYR
jgi:hypothetical protein